MEKAYEEIIKLWSELREAKKKLSKIESEATRNENGHIIFRGQYLDALNYQKAIEEVKTIVRRIQINNKEWRKQHFSEESSGSCST